MEENSFDVRLTILEIVKILVLLDTYKSYRGAQDLTIIDTFAICHKEAGLG